YRAHNLEGGDPAGLDELRRRCAAVVAEQLDERGHEVDSEAVREALLAALRFQPFPEVPAALRRLRAAGVRLVVASNWDLSLHEGAPRPRPSWPAWSAPVALIAGFGAAIFAYLVLASIAGAAGADPANPPSGVEIGATVIQDLALIASAVLFARLYSRPRPWH